MTKMHNKSQLFGVCLLVSGSATGLLVLGLSLEAGKPPTAGLRVRLGGCDPSPAHGEGEPSTWPCPQLNVPGVGLLYPREDALSKLIWRPRQKCQGRQNKEGVLPFFNEPVHWSWCSHSCTSASPLQSDAQAGEVGSQQRCYYRRSLNMSEAPRTLTLAPGWRVPEGQTHLSLTDSKV